jgi:hypothetical protein
MTSTVIDDPDDPPREFVTIVVFGADYENGVYVDSSLTEEWTQGRAIQDLLNMVDDDPQKEYILNAMPDDLQKIVKRLSSAMFGMNMRARMNGQRLREPVILFTESPPKDEVLIAWAKRHVFTRRRA